MRKIPKILHCIRIGDLPPPMKRINSWKEKHPTREYKLRGNKELEEIKRTNQRAINYYKETKQRAGVADCMRYEILNLYGGAMHGADSLCLNAIDELFEDGEENYVVDTSKKEGIEQEQKNINSVAPLYACVPGSEIAKRLIKQIGKMKNYGTPVKTVGNRLMQVVLNKGYKVKKRPLHYFIPEHFNGRKYNGPDKVFAKHYRGTTKGTYSQGI